MDKANSSTLEQQTKDDNESDAQLSLLTASEKIPNKCESCLKNSHTEDATCLPLEQQIQIHSLTTPLDLNLEKCKAVQTNDNVAPSYPTRLTLGIMTFLGAVFCYVTRSNFSLNLLAMVQPTPEQILNNITLPDYGPRFAWSPYEQSMLLGAFFYGYGVSAVPIGFMADQFGVAKATIFYMFLMNTILEIFSPMAAHESFEMSFAVRLAMGLLQGGFYPALNKLFSRWVPPTELGKFSFTCLGSCIGAVTSSMLSGVLIENFGWKYSFYVPGIMLACFTLAWYFLVFETPAQHPRITTFERNYIENSLNTNTGAKSKGFPPLKEFAMSPPVWALLFLQFGSDWGIYFILTGVPKFLSEILGFKLTSTGLLASLPYLARWFSAMLFGLVTDYIRKHSELSVTKLRKILCVFSHLLPGLFIFLIPYVSQYPYWCVAFMTISMGFNGAVAHTAVVNYQDLAPNYAATLNSIINGLSSFAGVLSPMVVSYFTRDRNTIDEWQYVFMVGTVVYITPALVFMVFGSGERQPWNTLKNKQTVQC